MKLSLLSIPVLAFTTALGLNAFASDLSEKVASDAESLLQLQEMTFASEEDRNEVVDFLQCFVSNMDLPAMVYINCATALVRMGSDCKTGMSARCISSLIRTGQACALPVSKAIQSVQLCLEPGEEGTELLYSEALD